MKYIDVRGCSLEEFLVRVHKALAGTGLDRAVTMRRTGSLFEVAYSHIGTSIVQFETVPTDGGFRAILKSQKIALAHKAFLSQIEKKLSSIVEDLGAQLVY